LQSAGQNARVVAQTFRRKSENSTVTIKRDVGNSSKSDGIQHGTEFHLGAFFKKQRCMVHTVNTSKA